MEENKKSPEEDFIANVLRRALSVKGFAMISAIFGISVLVGFAAKFGISLATLAVAIIGTLVIAFLYLVYSWAVGTKEKYRTLPAMVIVWLVTVLLSLTLCLIFSSVFFNEPLPIRKLVIEKLGTTETSEEESSGIVTGTDAKPETPSGPKKPSSESKPVGVEGAPSEPTPIDTPSLPSLPSIPSIPSSKPKPIDDVAIEAGKPETFDLDQKLGGEVASGAWPPNYAGGTAKMTSNLKAEVRAREGGGFAVYVVGSATFEELGGDGTKLQASIDLHMKDFPAAEKLSISTDNPTGSLSWSEPPGNPKDDPPKTFSSGRQGAAESGLVSMWRVYLHNGKLEVTFKEIRVSGFEKP